MKLSERGLVFLEGWESLRLKVYRDQGGKLTIGYGHLLTPNELSSGKLLLGNALLVSWKKGITEGQAHLLKRQDLEPFEQVVSWDMRNTPLKQHEFDALVILVFNIGIGAYRGVCSVPEKIRANNYQAAFKAWAEWNKVTNQKTGEKKRSEGLAKRRKAEIAIFKNADYSGRP